MLFNFTGNYSVDSLNFKKYPLDFTIQSDLPNVEIFTYSRLKQSTRVLKSDCIVKLYLLENRVDLRYPS